MEKKQIITGVVGVLLAGTSATGLIGWKAERDHVRALEDQVAELQRQEKRSAVDRSVSSQMEEIAFEQKIISDEQRENAIQQTRVANEMRERSEIERQNAIVAERNAVASEKKAIEASALAESQRQMAEHQRIQAEIAQHAADTLRFIALGRSLGSLSTLQYNAGNKDMAALLSCASYFFTNRYKGDIYNPAVFQALSLSSESKNEWSAHYGDVMDVMFLPNSDSQMVTVSTYGEILQHERTANRLQTKRLFADSRFDFRDLHVHDNGNIYAVSRTGHLYCKSAGKEQIIELTDNIHPTSFINMEDLAAVIGDNHITWINLQSNKIISTQSLPFRVTCVGIYKHMPLLFDDQGMMHIVKSAEDIESKKVPVYGQVSAYAYSNNTGYEVYGMNDGTIYFVGKAKNIRRLTGHRSRISKIKINGNRIYTSSFDGTVNLWIGDSEKAEPMTLYSSNNWLMHFTFDKSKHYLWIGDRWGNISEVLISITDMVDKIQRQLKREFTQEEWNYYIGKNVPYEKFKK